MAIQSGCCTEERKLTSQFPSITAKFSVQYNLKKIKRDKLKGFNIFIFLLSTECFQKIDLILLLDGSYSVTYENFELVKDWVKSLAANMDLSHERNQVGIVSLLLKSGLKSPQFSIAHQSFFRFSILIMTSVDPWTTSGTSLPKLSLGNIII